LLRISQNKGKGGFNWGEKERKLESLLEATRGNLCIPGFPRVLRDAKIPGGNIL